MTMASMFLESPLARLSRTASVRTRLEHLGLAGNIRFAQSSPFLPFVAPTLCCMELRNLFVDDLEGMITQIPETCDLERVYMENIWHIRSTRPNNYARSFVKGNNANAPYERAVKAYLLRESSILPKLQFEDGYQKSQHNAK